MSYLLAGIMVSLPFCAGLFTSCLLPRLAEISSFIFWWPSAHECWAKGMSAGCPPGVQTCTEASGDYSPAYLVSCSSGILGTGEIWDQREKKISPKYDEHCSTVMWLKQLSRLFCVVSLTCQFLAVSLFGAWAFLFLKTKYKQWRKKQPLYFSE